jgi:DNA-binding beta-propeller fold protein YncE
MVSNRESRKLRVGLVMLSLFLLCGANAQQREGPAFQSLPELPYKVVSNFFQMPAEMGAGEVSAVAVSLTGHIFLFRRAKPELIEFDERGQFLRQIGAPGIFTIPHGLRIDPEGNLWTTDTGSNLVLKLSPEGKVLLVLGRKGVAAEADWLFNKPADVAFGPDGDFFVADGYGNSRIMKFDRTGKLLKFWGTYGAGPGEFNLPHSIVIDQQGLIYVADREGGRIEIFSYDGAFLREWRNVGYPYGLYLTPDQHLFMADGGYDRVLEFDLSGRILGTIGEPGHAPGQFAWAHFLAVGPNRNLYVADVLNWRADVFVLDDTERGAKMSSYVPAKRMFDDQVPSTGWSTRQKH